MSETIFVARACHTFGRPQRCEAIRVRDGRIERMGTRRDLLRAKSRGGRVTDLTEFTVTPGLIDAHTHFFYWALNRALIIDVQGDGAQKTLSLAETLQRIRTESRKRRIGEWVVARGFDQNDWPRGFPTAADLDRAIGGAPAIVRSRDGHSAWLNTRGLRAAGIGENTPDPPGGRFLRDERGRPTGIAQENAINVLPDPVRELALRTDTKANAIVDAALADAYREAHKLGITGVHCMDDAAALGHFQRQRAAGKLGIRIVHSIPLENLDAACAIGLRSGIGDDWLRIGAVKIFADGALGSQTAWMFDEYPGRRGYRGVPVFQPKELREIVASAARRGWACWIHAIGDWAVHEATLALAAARKIAPHTPPHRIEHVQCARPADLKRMSQAGIHASMQPCHLLGDIDNADRNWPRARRYTHPWRSVLDAGVNLAAGSDVPIESIDPRRSLFAAANRTREDGTPRGGWFPDQRISVAECLRAFTVGAARSVHDVGAGALTPGQRADFTFWQDDPLKADPADLLNVRIAGCAIGGELHM